MLVCFDRSAGAKVAFDSNYRPKLWEDAATARAKIQSVWETTDFALPSVDDEMELFGDTSNAAVIDRFSERSWDGIAVKRGIRGRSRRNSMLLPIQNSRPQKRL